MKEHSLSDKEIEILQLIAAGYTSMQVGRLLNIHSRTVATYRAGIRHKLNARNTADMIRLAMSMRLIP